MALDQKLRSAWIAILISPILSGCLVEKPLDVTSVSEIPGGFRVFGEFGGKRELARAERGLDNLLRSITIEPCDVAYSDSWNPEHLYIQRILGPDDFSARESWSVKSEPSGIDFEVDGDFFCQERYRTDGPNFGKAVDWNQACATVIIQEPFQYKVIARSEPGDLSEVAAICEAPRANSRP